ncbi:tetratricopeptide repeat protein [Sulfuricurvum sp. IAE1]|jgi:tetratricopeptide (TPR) repeat protein|uniref:tetratricopeptide repeat protein n=1 Tax=Sulfuricurvum sp. IAE1 TaxID=2546102 RepID=UPI001047775D|nr:tetratricopeptide repeat protein [Sulfuricurvum sp. IAE1]MDD3768994.1 tetratricopeptide repeat protein [Sulfuricurvum sp.]MDX9966209.1 tetratricopeptide repeat protein [Sulfuricurvum sp.]TDA62528.1 tetratricopeptide repeat protein [Sulfuricurvum sp. IAE1]
MKTIQLSKTLGQANDYFLAGQYSDALREYSLALKDYPDCKEAYNGAILADMAMGGEAGAEALFDYYTILRSEDAEQADIVISEILETMDGTLEQLSGLFDETIKQRLAYEDGIMYNEFKELVKDDSDFNRIFENIMFSTRVIITEKEDFVDFLDNLIDHGYKEMALSYLESALGVYPNDRQLRNLLRRLAKGKNLEN